MEYERQKKYSGPVGKDPWGTIAQVIKPSSVNVEKKNIFHCKLQDWTKLSKGQPIDYAAELAVFRDLCSQRNSLMRRRNVFSGELKSVSSFDVTSKDWDNPDNFEHVVAKVARGSKRLRPFVSYSFMISLN